MIITVWLDPSPERLADRTLAEIDLAMERYADALVIALRKQWPEADVRVGMAAATAHAWLRVSLPVGTANAWRQAYAYEGAVQQIMQAVWDDGSWAKGGY
jgi:hypothetical protein